MKIERNEKGEVRIDNELSYKVPKNRSMLSVISDNYKTSNAVYDFRNDGWVYVDDKKLKKWCITRERIRLWEPKLKDIKALNNLYNKAFTNYKKYSTEVVSPLYDELYSLGGVGHCKPTHKYSGKQGMWWKYTISEVPCYGKGVTGISCVIWEERKPKNPLNVELTTKYYHASKRSEELANRYQKCKTILMAAIEDYLRENYPLEIKDQGKLLSLNIGFDTFLFICEVSGRGYCFWKLISHNDKMIEVTL